MTANPSRIVIINDASTALGGATGLALLSVELLSARGIPVTYVAGDDGQGERLKASRIDVVAVGGRGLVKEKKSKAAVRGLYNRATTDLLSAWISKHDRPDVIYHLHGWSKILSPSVLDALAPVASRTIVHAHDFFLVCPNGGFMDYPKGQPCERVPLSASCCLSNCDKRSYLQKLWRVARQRIVRSRLVSTEWARIVLIHELMRPYFQKAGLDADLLSVLHNPSSSFSEERINVEQNGDFLFVGRLEPEKGIEDAIEAAQIAKVPLKVFGDGPLKNALEARHPDIEFFGWRTRDEIAQVIKKARALVMPSRYPEPFGLVAVEAARSGLPVILAETAFLSEQFVRYGMGIRCDTRDIQKFAQAIAKVRDMPEGEIRTMSKRARSQVDNVSSAPDVWVDKLLGYYSNAISAR